MRLPDPHPLYGYRELPDCSRVYPSGVKLGRWLAWVCTGRRPGAEGKPVPDGEFIMTAKGLVYYTLASDAVRAIQRYQKVRRAAQP